MVKIYDSLDSNVFLKTFEDFNSISSRENHTDREYGKGIICSVKGEEYKAFFTLEVFQYCLDLRLIALKRYDNMKFKDDVEAER